MNFFGKGEWVRMKQECSGLKKGGVYQLGYINDGSRILYAIDNSGGYMRGCSCDPYWELVDNETAAMAALKA